MVDALPVAVEIAPPDAPREHVSALLQACSRALADAECVLASEAPEDETRAVAIVTWQGDGRAQVEVGLRRDGRPEWRSRTLDFEEKDEVAERWRTVGFVVGTLSRPELLPDGEPAAVPAAPAEEPEPRETEAPEEEPEPRPRPAPARVARGPARVAVDVGAATGPALDGMRAGALLRTRWPLHRSLRTLVGFQYLELPRDERGLSARWLTASAGLGVALGEGSTEVMLAVDGRVEYLHARTVDSDGRPFPGAGLGATGAWMPTSVLGLFVGAEAAWIFGTTALPVEDAEPIVDSGMRFNAEAGVRVRLW